MRAVLLGRADREDDQRVGRDGAGLLAGHLLQEQTISACLPPSISHGYDTRFTEHWRRTATRPERPMVTPIGRQEYHGRGARAASSAATIVAARASQVCQVLGNRVAQRAHPSSLLLQPHFNRVHSC